MTSITPCIWFDNQLEDAIRHYTAIFPDAQVTEQKRFPDGRLFTANFELAGQRFMALNGGPHFKLTGGVSFFVLCADQAEVDRYWDHLVEGGSPQRCGWLTDRFGLVWQIIPKALMNYLGDADAARANRVQQAMMQMVKIDIAALDRAAA